MSSSSSATNDKEEENSGEQQEQGSETGNTITGSISFATATEEEYLSSSSSSSKNVDNIDYSLYTEPIIIEMPQLDDVSDDKTNCYIEEWYKSEGDIIQSQDVICDISTPDFSFGMQIDDEDEIGILKHIHIKENIKVPDFTPICTIYYKKKKKLIQEEEEKSNKETE
ncbi:hypothetical protein FRACYDRAFT_254302 [Fragilariopsis cylindrus CCMP1102]|uniref:Lipoyl-binding domain-containing protein n=1 Tax=Fragilariopsis cylindrus CCMP1102 TaxID=635003 RepID=A0A1E7EKZ6_9STRA|nr:hypothetical protein FRACYDRAFT_254302 [Fragilariopsis cylindrus CCMP1102]|eukprot:OEU06590.1 hypothetical protein FRACYDRAFT_254302 [Fragilariopsis cylindrus CCMP1102]